MRIHGASICCPLSSIWSIKDSQIDLFAIKFCVWTPQRFSHTQRMAHKRLFVESVVVPINFHCHTNIFRVRLSIVFNQSIPIFMLSSVTINFNSAYVCEKLLHVPSSFQLYVLTNFNFINKSRFIAYKKITASTPSTEHFVLALLLLPISIEMWRNEFDRRNIGDGDLRQLPKAFISQVKNE